MPQDIKLFRSDTRQVSFETGFDWTNVGTSSSRSVKVIKPDLTTATATHTAITVVEATNGLVTYSLSPDQAGEWMVQFKGTTTGGVTYYGPVTIVRVSDPI